LVNKRKKCRIGSTRKGEHPDLEAELNRELQEMRNDGVLINGHTIIAHAFAIARERNIQSFNGSRGWLLGFLKRRWFYKLTNKVLLYTRI
jgi:hypothetical protein